MTNDRPLSEKTLRQDAKRNRQLLLNAARDAFSTEGLSVSMDEIARRAGLGVGTAYRHFPRKELLYDAVIHTQKQRLIEQAASLLEQDDAVEAFFSFIMLVVEKGSANRAFIEELTNYGHDFTKSEGAPQFRETFAKLLIRAQASGSIRTDVSVDDLIVLLASVIQTMIRRGLDASTYGHLVSVLCDGLRSSP